MNAVPDSQHRRTRTSHAQARPRLSPVDAISAANTTSLPPRSRLDNHEVTSPMMIKGQPLLAGMLLSLRAAAPAVISALTLYLISRVGDFQQGEHFQALTILVTVLSILLLQPSRSTASQLIAPRLRLVAELLLRWGALLLVLLAIGFFAGQLLPLTPALLAWATLTPLVLVVTMLLLDVIARRVLVRPQHQRKAVFVGYNGASRQLADRFHRHPELCMAVQGFFDDRSQDRLKTREDVRLLGGLTQLPAFVKNEGVDVIFLSLPMKHLRRVQDLLQALGDTTASLYYVPDVYMSGQYQARAGEILGVPVIALRETPFHGYRGVIKRMMDIVISAIALVLLSPLLALIALGIRLSSPGPMVFKQRRYGLDGQEILIYKFRTMTVTEDSGWVKQASRNDSRVTPLGRLLRRSSLDEIPQLWNVLQGRMSLVGPRPHAVSHNEEYRRLINGYMVRHKVPPGITGLAQINGYRGATPRLQDMQGRVYYDLEYLRHWSLWLDIKILLLTVPRLIKTDQAF